VIDPSGKSAPSYRPGPEMAGVVDRNIRALVAREEVEEKRKSVQDRIADAITRFTGSMRFVYLHVAIFGAWIIINLGWTPLPQFDESFVILAMVASVEAIFLSTFVLISQNRMAALAEKRAELDLQVSLLAEHEVTRLLQLTIEVGAKLGVDTAKYRDLDQLTQDIAPEKVLDRMEDAERAASATKAA
jgi:uncharacterized membrane protein